jgi:hypothetical protein
MMEPANMAHDVANYMVGKGIAYWRKFSATPTTWAITTAYSAGAYVNNGDYLWTTASGGTSSTGVGPTGSTGTFTDGTVVWTSVPWIDLGNCPKFSFTPEIETLEHFSSREGVKTRDKKVVISQKASLSLELDEITVENLELALLGDTTGATGSREVQIFANSQIDGQVKLVGSNSVGNTFTHRFKSVSVTPDAEVDFIGDDWAVLSLKMEVNLDSDSVYGTTTET